MSNEVLNSVLPSSMKFDDLGVLEINDPNLLAAVAAGTGNTNQDGNTSCYLDGGCSGDWGCVGDMGCKG